MIRKALLPLIGALLVATPLSAAPRFIGPWFIDSTLNRATGGASLTAGQNTTELGITFTCFDRHLSLGVWKPHGSLGLQLGLRTTATVQVDHFPPVGLVGIGTQRNLAEFDLKVGLVMRQMLSGRTATLAFDDNNGNSITETFPLDNTDYAFGPLAQNCPLQ